MSTDLTVHQYAAIRGMPYQTARLWALRGLLGPLSSGRPMKVSSAWLKTHGLLSLDPTQQQRERLTAEIQRYIRTFPQAERRDALIRIMQELCAVAGIDAEPER